MCALQMHSIEVLSQQLKAKERELRTIRRLAKDILRQRSDVEEFFLDSLEYVREQALAQQRAEQKQVENQYLKQVREATLNSAVNFPPIIRANLGSTFPRGNLVRHPELKLNIPPLLLCMSWCPDFEFRGTQGSRLPDSEGKKVDLADLTWQDKEQVLRMLFAKINHAQQQRRTASAPNGAEGFEEGPEGGGGGLFAGEGMGMEQDSLMGLGMEQDLARAMGGAVTMGGRPALS